MYGFCITHWNDLPRVLVDSAPLVWLLYKIRAKWQQQVIGAKLRAVGREIHKVPSHAVPGKRWRRTLSHSTAHLDARVMPWSCPKGRIGKSGGAQLEWEAVYGASCYSWQQKGLFSRCPPLKTLAHLVAPFPSLCASPMAAGGTSRTKRNSTNQGVFLASGDQLGFRLKGSLSSEV